MDLGALPATLVHSAPEAVNTVPSLHPITISEWATVKHDTGAEGAWTFLETDTPVGATSR